MRAFELACGVPWAITPEGLELLLAVARREGEDLEALETRLGRPLDNQHPVGIHGTTAVIPITGPIFRHANLFTKLSGATSLGMLALNVGRAAADPAIQNIVLAIDSPGGEAAGINEFAKYLRELGGQKRIIAYVENLAASAGYWIASAASEIVIDETAQLGSIGVVAVAPRREEGGPLQFVSSQSPKKRLDPESEAGQAEVQAVVDALAEVFVETVARHRNVSTADVLERFGQGGILVGKYAVEAGLADRIGSLDALLTELGARDTPPVPMRDTPRRAASARTQANEGTAKGTNVDEREQQITATIQALEASGVSGDVIAELKGQLDAIRQEYEAAEQRNVALVQRVERMERKELEDGFKAEVLGLANDGLRWVGNPEEQVGFLMKLAQVSGGKDSEMVQQYIAQQRAVAAQAQESVLLAEVGTAGAKVSGSGVKERLEAAAKVYVERDRLTMDQAMVKAMSDNPDLRDQFYAEHGVAPSRQRMGR